MGDTPTPRGLAGPLPMPTIATRVMGFVGMSFPRVLAKLNQLLRSPGTRAEALVGGISSDPLLTAMVLANANTVQPIASLTDALQQVGVSSALGLVQDCRPVPAHLRPWFLGYWQEANATALLTRLLARWLQANRRYPGYLRESDETLHLFGLLHNLGSAVGMLLFPEHYQQAGRDQEGDPDGGRSFPHLFKNRLGIAPGDLGYMLACNWRLPALIAEGCRYHLHPLKSERQVELHAVLHVARTLARACGHCDPSDSLLEPIDDGVLSLLNLRTSDFESLVNLFLDAWDEQELYELSAE